MTRLARTLVVLALATGMGLARPAPASALSCMRPDVRTSYQRAAKSPDTYIVVQGSVDFNTAGLPKSARTAGKVSLLPARLTGRMVARNGYGSWLDQKITLRVTCVSEWCGAVPSGTDMLMFLRRDRNGYVLDVGPCPMNSFPTPRASTLKHLRSCMSGGPCTPRRG